MWKKVSSGTVGNAWHDNTICEYDIIITKYTWVLNNIFWWIFQKKNTINRGWFTD